MYQFRLASENSHISQTSLGACCIAATAGLIFCFVTAVSIQFAQSSDTKIIIKSQINPNTASMGSLLRLEGIGSARAKAIIHYRNGFTGTSPAFKNPLDLQNIKGIGQKTVEKLLPQLTFD